MFNPEIKTANTVLSAKYGYRFLPVTNFKKSENERKAIKRMKKYVTNKPIKTVKLHSIDELKLKILNK